MRGWRDIYSYEASAKPGGSMALCMRGYQYLSLLSINIVVFYVSLELALELCAIAIVPVVSSIDRPKLLCCCPVCAQIDEALSNARNSHIN